MFESQINVSQVDYKRISLYQTVFSTLRLIYNLQSMFLNPKSLTILYNKRMRYIKNSKLLYLHFLFLPCLTIFGCARQPSALPSPTDHLLMTEPSPVTISTSTSAPASASVVSQEIQTDTPATYTPTGALLPEQSSPAATSPETGALPKAYVLSVQVSGDPGAYTFSVEISSPDLGCQQYADWWEVVSGDGDLLYRRILTHSHVGEQPFVRSGGPVDIAPEQEVWVRAHMNPGGYGGVAFKGTARDGFQPAEPTSYFGAALEEMPPLPQGCAF